MTTPAQPRWLADLARTLPIRSQFVISGNIRDTFLAGVSGQTALVTGIDEVDKMVTLGVEVN